MWQWSFNCGARPGPDELHYFAKDWDHALWVGGGSTVHHSVPIGSVPGECKNSNVSGKYSHLLTGFVLDTPRDSKLVLQNGRLTENINLFVPSLEIANLNTNHQSDQTLNLPPNLQNSTSDPNPQPFRFNFSNKPKSNICPLDRFYDLVRGVKVGH